MARAAELYARLQKLSDKLIRSVVALRVDAMALLGRRLQERPRTEGTRCQLDGKEAAGDYAGQPPEDGPILEQLGISKQESSDAQALAWLKENEPALYEQVRAGEVSVEQAIQQERCWA
jgi:hypothetical protein